MSDFLPFFPLNLVVYPDETLNLHIFEDRYRQLIHECLNDGRTFGIPTYLEDRLPGFGTEVGTIRLHKQHENGTMDISARGIRVFRIKTFENPTPGKPYAGGDVSYLPEDTNLIRPLPLLIQLLNQLYTLLTIAADYEETRPPFSFQVAHKVGLSLADQYELLTMQQESERQQFLIRHLQKVLPIVSEMEQTKSRIRMNGHFRNLDPLNF
jgi:Lon protease-like protein